MDLTLTYFYQSGFSIGIDKTLLIFSYFENKDMISKYRYQISARELKPFNNIVVFMPSMVREHFEPALFDLPKTLPVKYVISSDAAHLVPKDREVYIVNEGDKFELDNLVVEVYGSSGLGVSFFVHIRGLSIFHGGDLNLWHWREESSQEEIEEAKLRFTSALSTLPKQEPDLAFFALDPNQGRLYDAGANQYVSRFKPKVFVPMHWGERDEVAATFAQQNSFSNVAVCVLRYPRQSVVIDYSKGAPLFRENGMSEHNIAPLGEFANIDTVDLPFDI